MTMRTNGETAWEYEREAEAHRHRLVETLDELNARLSPGQMLDEVMSYARLGGGNFGHALKNAATHHPVPTLLIAAGSLLFMSDKLGLGLSERMGLKGSSARERSTHRGYSGSGTVVGGAAAETAGWGAQTGYGSARGMYGSPRDGGYGAAGMQRSGMPSGRPGEGMMQRAGEAVSDAASSAAERARDAAYAAGEYVSDAAQAAREQMAYAADRTGETARHMAYRTRSVAEDQPLMTVAVGVAVGALVSMLLPRLGGYRGGDWEGGERGWYGGQGSGSWSSRAYAERAREAAYSAMDRAGETASGVREQVSDTVGQVAQSARELGSTVQGYTASVRDQVSGTVGQVAQSARELGSTVGSTVQDYSAAMREQMAYAAGRSSETARHMAYRTRSFAEEQPLIAAAIGVAIGAVLAAALPKTRAEDDYLGEAADSVKQTLRETASEQYQSLKGAASRVAENVGTAAREEGLTTDDAAASAREVGEKVKRVVQEGAQAAKSEVDRMTKGDRGQ